MKAECYRREWRDMFYYEQWLVDNYSYMNYTCILYFQYLPEYKFYLQSKYKKTTVNQKVCHIRKCINIIMNQGRWI